MRLLSSLSTLVLAVVTQQALATESPAPAPAANLVGTYSLTYFQSNAGGPYTAGQSVTLVLTSKGDLCVNNVHLTDPVNVNNNQFEAKWVDTTNNVAYFLSNYNGNFNEVNLNSTVGGTFLGQLRGSLTSTDATCGTSSNPYESQLSTSAKTVFAKAQILLPSLFSDPSDYGIYQGYIYRFYAKSGVYVGIKNDTIYLLGGPFGNAIVMYGTVANTLAELTALESH